MYETVYWQPLVTKHQLNVQSKADKHLKNIWHQFFFTCIHILHIWIQSSHCLYTLYCTIIDLPSYMGCMKSQVFKESVLGFFSVMLHIFVIVWHLICAMNLFLLLCCDSRLIFFSLTDCAEHSNWLEYTAKRWSGSPSDWEELTLILDFNSPKTVSTAEQHCKRLYRCRRWRRSARPPDTKKLTSFPLVFPRWWIAWRRDILQLVMHASFR